MTQFSKPVLVFDVNETLLDMTPKKSYKYTLKEEQGFRIWFECYYSTVLTALMNTTYNYRRCNAGYGSDILAR
jgi:2-haloacid dehalogenase